MVGSCLTEFVVVEDEVEDEVGGVMKRNKSRKVRARMEVLARSC